MIDPFEIYQKIHFIGIGGIGISALARLLKQKKHLVSGSDQTRSHNVDLLSAEGINISIGHTSSSLPKDSQLVIYTSAIPEDNPELQMATQLSLPTLTYPQAIGQLTTSYSTISVCGTHGKTTITALLGHILLNMKLDPTIIVGSLVKDFSNSNVIVGNSNLLLLESCEYKEAFLKYSPQIIILNNIDPEHLDYFKNKTNYINAFRKFIGKLPKNGILIANTDDKNIKLLINEKKYLFKIVTFGTKKQKTSNHFQLNQDQLILPDGHSLKLEPSIPGKHNLMNSSAVLATCHALDLDVTVAGKYLKNYQGAARRLELKGHFHNKPVIDDYGHAPAEIRATLSALKSKYGPNTKILCIFQPHQYSRTHLFLNEFAESFTDAAKVFIPNIYRSRDTAEDMAKVNVDILVEAINQRKPAVAINTHDFLNTLDLVNKHHNQFDLILTIGAGDITRLAMEIISPGKDSELTN